MPVMNTRSHRPTIVGPASMVVAVAISLAASAAGGATISVWATALHGSEYELWGSDTPCPWNDGTGYYDAPLYGYVELGRDTGDAVFVAPDYEYYVIGTRSEMALDAVKLPDGSYLDGESLPPSKLVWTGNSHRPFQFDPQGNLIGDGFDYAHVANLWGPPDGVTDHLGFPPQYGSSGQSFQGHLVFQVPEPATLSLLALAGLTLTRRRCR